MRSSVATAALLLGCVVASPIGNSASAPAGSSSTAASPSSASIPPSSTTAASATAASNAASSVPASSGPVSSPTTSSTTASLGSATVSSPGAASSSPIGSIPGPNGRPSNTDPTAWCATQNFDDAQTAVDVWENWGVGYWFASWLDEVNQGDANWPFNLYKFTHPDAGDPGTEDCGTPGAQCNPSLDCEQMVKDGYAEAYYALDILWRFQSYLNVGSTLLQQAVTSDILNIPQLAQDFDAPKTYETAADLAAFLSSALFIFGGVANLASLGLSAAATEVEESVEADVGTIESNIARVQGEIDSSGALPPVALKDELESLQNQLETAESNAATVSGLKTGSSASSVLGGAIYLMGSSFGMVSDATGPEDQVNQVALDELVYNLFNSSVKNLETIGQLATGGPGNYSLLPNQPGIIDFVGSNNSVAGFFSDGKFLYGAPGGSTFVQQTKDAYGLFLLKLVDLALQGSGYSVLANTDVTDQSDCTVYGSQWIDSNCFALYQYDSVAQNCEGIDGQYGGDVACNWIAASNDIYNSMQSYGMNVADYYNATYNCAISGQYNLDVTSLPLDGSLPTCWFNMPTKQAVFLDVGHPAPVQDVRISNFTVTGTS